MGNWSVAQGIQEEYDSLLQDIGSIKHYRIATVVVRPIFGYLFDFITLDEHVLSLATPFRGADRRRRRLSGLLHRSDQ